MKAKVNMLKLGTWNYYILVGQERHIIFQISMQCNVNSYPMISDESKTFTPKYPMMFSDSWMQTHHIPPILIT